MFTIEQHTNRNSTRKAKNDLFKTGMPLANPHPVKLKFTYKEFTLIIGIAVALIVVLTLWMSRFPASGGTEKPDSVSKASILPVKEVLRKAALQILF